MDWKQRGGVSIPLLSELVTQMKKFFWNILEMTALLLRGTSQVENQTKNLLI
jgi:hypothetical protein